jgi:DNA-binding PadR family transcriptional regulator
VADLQDPAYWDTAILRAAGRLLMLAAFEEQPRHGYDIAKRLTSVCGDWCTPSPAMIYPAIHELEAAGLIACEVESSGRRNRRVCSLTDEGREALRVGVAAWSRFMPTIARVVAESGVDVAPCGAVPAACESPCAE